MDTFGPPPAAPEAVPMVMIDLASERGQVTHMNLPDGRTVPLADLDLPRGPHLSAAQMAEVWTSVRHHVGHAGETGQIQSERENMFLSASYPLEVLEEMLLSDPTLQVNPSIADAIEQDSSYSMIPVPVFGELPPFSTDIDFHCTVCVSGLPRPPADGPHIGLLHQRLHKLLTPHDIRYTTLHLPVGDDGVLKGFCIVLYASLEDAQTVAERVNQAQFDKSTVLQALPFYELETLRTTPAVFPEDTGQEHSEIKDPFGHLTDHRGRDQYLLHFCRDTSTPNGPTVSDYTTRIMWNDYAGLRHQQVLERKALAAGPVRWSRYGMYLAALHPNKVLLHAGNDFACVRTFVHAGVSSIAFSPREGYLITYAEPDTSALHGPMIHHASPSAASAAVAAGRAASMSALKLWDIFTGVCIAEFPFPALLRARRQAGGPAALQWGCGDEYVSILQQPNRLHIYRLPTMQQLRAGGLKLRGILGYAWSPVAPYLAYWAPTAVPDAAAIFIIDVKARRTLRRREVVGVRHITFRWHPQGTYLCARIDQKTRRGSSFSCELFRIAEKHIPSDTVSFPGTSPEAFAWEPIGHRFVVITGDHNPPFRVWFFTMRPADARADTQALHRTTPLLVLENRLYNRAWWSSLGRYLALGALNSPGGSLEFWDMDMLRCMSAGASPPACPRMSTAAWDPTGRFLATATTGSPAEATLYAIWGFDGTPMWRESVHFLTQFQWRPRRPTIMSRASLCAVRSHLDTHIGRFAQETADLYSMQDMSQLRERDAQRKEWDDHWSKCIQVYHIDRILRRQHRASKFSSDQDDDGDSELTVRDTIITEEVEEEVIA